MLQKRSLQRRIMSIRATTLHSGIADVLDHQTAHYTDIEARKGMLQGENHLKLHTDVK